MRLFKTIVICSVLFGCTSGQDMGEYPEFVSERIEKSRESASMIDLFIDAKLRNADSLRIEFIMKNRGSTSVDIQHSSSYPLLMIYTGGEMIEPSPEILDELVIFHDLETTRIGAKESKLIKEITVKKPSESHFRLRGYMAFKMEIENSLNKEFHSISCEKVVER